LPGVVESAEDVVIARRKLDGVQGEEGDGMVIVDDEQTALMAGQAFPIPDDDNTKSKVSEYHRAISLATSRISSIGIGVGYMSGVSMLCLMLIPVTSLGGSLFSLRLAIGISGIWWAVWTIPAARLLQASGGHQTDDDKGYEFVKGKMKDGWKRVGTMLRWNEIQRLSVTFWYLLAWALLSDGELRLCCVVATMYMHPVDQSFTAFNTTTSLAVLFGRTSLSMPSSHVILIGILTQSTAIVSSIYTPRFQRKFGGTNGLSNLHMLVGCVIGVMLMCAYVLLGFVGGWKVGGLRTEGEMYACAVWFGIVSVRLRFG
jgi:MFS transporter, UMF1 family